MTYGFGLVTLGILLLYSGYNGQSLISVLRGIKATPDQRETAFDVALKVISAGGSAVTPGSGGEGSTAPEKSSKGGKEKVPGGLTTFDGTPICKWIADELSWAREHGWTGRVESGYRSEQHQREVCATGVTPCATPGTSNHEGKSYPGCAVDVTEAEQLDKVLSKKPFRRLKWTGNSIGDPVHFSSGLQGV